MSVGRCLKKGNLPTGRLKTRDTLEPEIKRLLGGVAVEGRFPRVPKGKEVWGRSCKRQKKFSEIISNILTQIFVKKFFWRLVILTKGHSTSAPSDKTHLYPPRPSTRPLLPKLLCRIPSKDTQRNPFTPYRYKGGGSLCQTFFCPLSV